MKTQKWKKALSLLLAFAMIFVLALPAANAAGEEKTETVTLHKLMLTEDQFNAWKPDQMEKNGLKTITEGSTKYVVNGQGQKLYKHGSAPNIKVNTVKGNDGIPLQEEDIASLGLDKYVYDATNAMDMTQMEKIANLNGVEGKISEVAGVYFVWQDPKNPKDASNKDQYILGDPNDLKKPALNGTDLQYTTDVKKAMGGLTTANGIIFDTKNLPNGTYQINEIPSLSNYKSSNPEGKAIVQQKAVPVVLTLPLVNENGTVKNMQVYPKNLDDKPVPDKNFQKEHKLPEVKEKTAEDNSTLHQGALPENTGATKAKVTAKVGEIIPYETMTAIMPGAKYAKLVLSDIMDEALTYNDDLEVKVGYLKKAANGKDDPTFIELSNILSATGDYTVVKDDRGFTLTFTKDGLEKLSKAEIPQDQLEGSTGQIVIYLKYHATVNGKAEVDTEIKNGFAVDFGHKPGKDIEEKPVTPKEGKLTVNKTWAVDGKNGNVPTKKPKVVYTLTKKNDTEVLKQYSVTLTGNEENNSEIELDKVFKGPNDPTEDDYGKPDQWQIIKYIVTGPYAGRFEGLPTLKTGEKYSITERVAGYDVTIEPNDTEGSVKLTNNEDTTNPKPIEPTVPSIVNGGKKFVKVGKENNRLYGAEFYVTRNVKDGNNQDTKEYLSLKSGEKVDQAIKLYEAAQEKYLKAIADYNAQVANKVEPNERKITVGTETITGDQNIIDRIAVLKTDRDNKFLISREAYEWVTDKTKALILTSNDQGQVEITGLAYGSYALEEKTAPEGFAKLNGDITFEVNKGSYTSEGSENKINYVPDNTSNDALKVLNKEVTIPQTGGIGTVIFTVVGIAMVAGAFIILRKNREDQYA